MISIDIGLLVLVALAIAIGWFLGFREARKQKGRLVSIFERFFDSKNHQQAEQAISAIADVLELSSETFEAHLSLGALFRRRGEVEKAIELHERLLNTPGMAPEQLDHAHLELARDYQSAGVLDRAETLFQALVDNKSQHSQQAMRHLIHIFELEKDWHSAIAVAGKLSRMDSAMLKGLAHYWCELAEQSWVRGEENIARRDVHRAIEADASCARAYLLLVAMEFEQGNHELVIEHALVLVKLEPSFAGECIDKLIASAKVSMKLSYVIEVVSLELRRVWSAPLLLALAKVLAELHDEKASSDILLQVLGSSSKAQDNIPPKIEALNSEALISRGNGAEGLSYSKVVDALSSDKSAFVCTSCGFKGQRLHWLCPSCQKWGSAKLSSV